MNFSREPHYFVKLIKIRFTHWRDQGTVARTPAFEKQLAYWNSRVGVLSREAADLAAHRAHADSVWLQNSLARITVELQRVEAERTLLLTTEAAERNDASNAREHKRVGTFGYQILDDAGIRVIRVVDEGGNDLPETAVYFYEVVDFPALPAWAMQDGRALRSIW